MTQNSESLSHSVKPLYLLAIASGLLLYASFFPLNLGILAWAALVPLLFLVRSPARPRHVYLAAYVGGLAFYLPAIQWMRVASAPMYATWITLALYSSIYFPLGLFLIRRFDRASIPLLLTVPAVWVGFEYMRAHFPTGFSWLESFGVRHYIGFGWYFLGYSQHDCSPLIQIADVTGVYGVSLLIVLVNVTIFSWIWNVRENRSRPWLATGITAALLASTIAYGYSRLDHPEFETGPRVALLQSNLPQSIKMGDMIAVRNQMASLLEKAVNVPADQFPALVVWPETTCDEGWVDVDRAVDKTRLSDGWKKALDISQALGLSMAGHDVDHYFPGKNLNFDIFAAATEGHATNQLLGLNCLEMEADGQKWKYNSAQLINKSGKAGPRYDKMHLVPFGEYVPLRNTFPWMDMFTPYKSDYSCKPGEHWTRFPLPVDGKTYQFGCIICYEDSDPGIPRQYALASSEGPSVDFLVNISNDGWFRGTEEHEQHFAICRFRAIECRRSVVRAVNMGISGIIDGDGRIVKIPGPTWAESKKIDPTVVNGLVPIDRRESLYAHWGDWLPLTCWGITIVSLIVTCFYRSSRGA